MTPDQIAEMFVRAAEIEAKLPIVKGLKEQWGKYPLHWVHDIGDINMRRVERTAAERARLVPGDDPLGDWGKFATRVFDEWEKQNSKGQVGEWEACLAISIEFIPKATERRALWAWAMAQAGTLTRRIDGRGASMSFDKWCKSVEHISRTTGYDRKLRAIRSIETKLCGKGDLRARTLQDDGLQLYPENRHVPDKVPGVHEAKPNPTWRDDPAFAPIEFQAARERRRQQARKRAAP